MRWRLLSRMLHRRGKDVTKADNGAEKSDKKGSPRTATDSSLREGIRGWLVEVE
jgi:hypothetical protein